MVVYREPMSKWNYLLVPLLFLWMLAITVVWDSTGSDTVKSFFSWLPAWAFDPVPDDLSGYASWALTVTAILTFVVNGVFGPGFGS